jgi:hypothetical protein
MDENRKNFIFLKTSLCAFMQKGMACFYFYFFKITSRILSGTINQIKFNVKKHN